MKNTQNKKSILKIVNKVFQSGQLILSKEVENFENNFAKYTNNKFAIGVNSGTDALQIALMAIGIKQNDEVITVSNTAVPTVCAIVSCGAKPIYVDVKQEDYLIDTSLIEKKISKKTKAIIPVNLYGQCANYSAINKIAKKYNLKVIEDCAQSAGALQGRPSGSFGDLGAFSFYPTKNLGGYGDGGMIVTSNKDLYLKCKKLRKYGMEKLYYSDFHGINSRLDEVHAGILNFHLNKLDLKIRKRRRIANLWWKSKNTDLILPTENEENLHANHVYVVNIKRGPTMNYLKK